MTDETITEQPHNWFTTLLDDATDFKDPIDMAHAAGRIIAESTEIQNAIGFALKEDAKKRFPRPSRSHVVLRAINAALPD